MAACEDESALMPFRTGPDINPFSAAARDGMLLMESVTPAQIAAAVPRIVITKIDFKTGKPVEDVRPLMYDLVETPQFGAMGDSFGADRDRFTERSTVSLNSLEIKTNLNYGVDVMNEVILKFTVHRPDIVFDRASKIPWREILEEGHSFSLEYGWIADPVACPNELFNGFGFVAPSGHVIKSTKTVLLLVARWVTNLKQNGEVDVTVFAYENGDIALREVRFADTAGVVIGLAGPADPGGTRPKISDNDAARALFNRMRSLVPTTIIGKGKFYRLVDVLDEIAAPMLEEAVRGFGYRGSPPIRMALSNFNMKAGRQSRAWGGRHMGGVTSIADFLIPADRLVEEFSKHIASGRAMTLRNFLNVLFHFINSDEAWERVSGEQLRPMIGVSYETIKTEYGFSLNMMVLDRNAVADNVRKLKKLPLDRQSKTEVHRALANSDVPVLEFARAGSVILDASFEMQPTPLLQAIQIETAELGRKSRVERSKMPDVESRKGYAMPHDIVPISILEGDVTMYGNFVLNVFDRIWVEFFGSSSISGIFNVLSRNDKIEPGVFTTTFHLMSEGIDPLNTRFRFTPEEDAERQRAQAALKSKPATRLQKPKKL